MRRAGITLLQPMIRTVRAGLVCVEPKQVDAVLGSDAHKRWREIVKKRAGYACEAMLPDGRRCGRMDGRLFADHIRERSDGGAEFDPANGQCLCGSHHTTKTLAARAARVRG